MLTWGDKRAAVSDMKPCFFLLFFFFQGKKAKDMLACSLLQNLQTKLIMIN